MHPRSAESEVCERNKANIGASIEHDITWPDEAFGNKGVNRFLPSGELFEISAFMTLRGVELEAIRANCDRLLGPYTQN
jgi:hypothetical protein